ncbi:DUF1449 family protein [Adhaeribacter swui]|uniref:DUF1449 family protein n=1 Tax=Adhaeribacter swui TaxID=2086471 RepID=A0A7G7G6E7_9BACT|nr:OB-fold-containig protein [Adhaeribacter swui]QNF32731.1 DUF1449 family protein [Adhaeribacter swui]
MSEFLQAASASVNIIPSILLLFALLYWAVVILGILDLDMLDMDLEMDSSDAIVWLNHALGFFNVGKIPFMIFFSFVALPFWAASILLNYYLNTGESLVGFVLLIPLFIFSLLASKVLTYPFVKIFAALEKEHDSKASVIGRVCTVTLPVTATEMGQATVRTTGSLLLLNVKATSGAYLKKGETGLIIDYNAAKQFYLIEPYQSLAS